MCSYGMDYLYDIQILQVHLQVTLTKPFGSPDWRHQYRKSSLIALRLFKPNSHFRERCRRVIRLLYCLSYALALLFSLMLLLCYSYIPFER